MKMYKYTFTMLLAELFATLIGMVLGSTIVLMAWHGLGFRNEEMFFATIFAAGIGLIPFFLLVLVRGK
jgi:predicted membrane protein